MAVLVVTEIRPETPPSGAFYFAGGTTPVRFQDRASAVQTRLAITAASM
ncbi:MAG: hypothetical protein WDO73_37560 [Ignavibacteriota bacterium]